MWPKHGKSGRGCLNEESGLKNIMLMDVPTYTCASCGETEVEIPAMEELHCLIGLFVLYQPDRLKSAEVRYLRKHMGYSQDDSPRI